MYRVAQAALDGTAPATIARWMNRDGEGPRGRWADWADLAAEQRQLPPEARDVLAAEGIGDGDFGPYRFATAYVNNELHGEGPHGSSIEGWAQGDRFAVKLVNLDNHTHYFRNVDFGPRLHDDISSCCGAGSHSFEIMNFKLLASPHLRGRVDPAATRGGPADGRAAAFVTGFGHRRVRTGLTHPARPATCV